jgi:catechol 2,3-dioxygenase-like lactoylglutathione lyase family enzyme
MYINHVTVLVSDKKRSEEFYTKVLGFEKQHDIGNALWIKIGEQFVHISVNSGAPMPGTFYHFAIAIEDMKTYLQGLIAKGIDVFDLDTDQHQIRVNEDLDVQIRQFFVRDPDGNLIEFCDVADPFFNGGTIPERRE